MLGWYLVLVTQHLGLQLVLSKTIKIGDTQVDHIKLYTFVNHVRLGVNSRWAIYLNFLNN